MGLDSLDLTILTNVVTSLQVLYIRFMAWLPLLYSAFIILIFFWVIANLFKFFIINIIPSKNSAVKTSAKCSKYAIFIFGLLTSLSIVGLSFHPWLTITGNAFSNFILY
jgi:hypothetical protein